MTTTSAAVIVLCSLSVLSPVLGGALAGLLVQQGDAAGKGMGAGLVVLGTMFVIAVVGGIASVVCWVASEEPFPWWARTLVFLTFLAPCLFLFATEHFAPWVKRKVREFKRSDASNPPA